MPNPHLKMRVRLDGDLLIREDTWHGRADGEETTEVRQVVAEQAVRLELEDRGHEMVLDR